MSQDYNQTLNLPKTDFSMRAALPTREPEMLKEFEEKKIYEGLMEKNEGKPLFVLHDGPPYANGDIHLGTALNKALKDIIVRYKNMTGYKAPFVPGWDTHGLPTELKARKKAGVENSSAIEPVELRKLCREFTLDYLDDQRKQFKRLGVIGEWDNPYITLLPEFEAKQIEIFCEMATKGYIYKGKKPVYWCPDCQTALADAEIEYADDKCHSIYVKFRVTDDKGLLSKLGAELDKTYFVIWTTTTWTLPGNVAICVGPDFEYSVIKSQGEYFVMATELYEKAFAAKGVSEYEVIGTIKGSELEYMKTQHPFLERQSLVIVGDHVTLESGTGCVHTAPGHGVEDYDVCRNYKELEIIVPVDSQGKLNELAGQFSGLDINVANKEIAQHLEETGALFALEQIVHQYPHCWRCKNPIIFRATEQWFCSVESIKDKAIEAIKKVEWIPEWGEDRITSMVRDRQDWCISRQRRWGVPIPIFYCEKCGKELMTRESIMSVAKLFREKGSDAWYTTAAKDILPEGTVCECGCGEFKKENDIMDVWFDSGVTHAAVCEERENLKWPADMYLEGADQYRGWFQSSLLTSVAWRGEAPYKSVVTHGWVVDGEGKKMSKSLGNGILPQEIFDGYGADILRLWVASSDYHADIRISPDILKQLSEAYRKIRNTARYILGNLSDFNPDTDMVSEDKLLSIDKFALSKLSALLEKTRKAYEAYEFHQVFHSIHNFCVVDMSNFYLDVLKDRLYCEKTDGYLRRAAQTTMFIILDTMERLIAPVLAFTSEEIWNCMPHRSSDNDYSVLYNDIPEKLEIKADADAVSMWDKIHEIRDDVSKALENARNAKVIGKSLEAKVVLYAKDELYDFIKSVEKELATAFIVSEIEVINGAEGEYKGELENLSVSVLKANGEKCERCWIFSDTVGKNEKHPTLCKRCAEVVD
ncbi:MAG: isoleucine--tRNA ligase [Ruminococcaceae bacterium]|nr:isoleucine--tRNA ligase [Oscillospiraceae bacterium]